MQKSSKYLYGKKENLGNFIRDGGPLWFRDIYALKMLENEVIRDNECSRNFNIDSKQITSININGQDFQLAKNSKLKLSQPTRRCHVLCLSNNGNNKILFQRFRADICIELNVELLIQILKESYDKSNIEVIGKDVEYFSTDCLPESIDPFDLVFKKDADKYHIENEFRIAIFWPYDHKTLMQSESGNSVSVFNLVPNDNDHICLNFKDIDLKKLILNVKEEKGKEIKT
jgi:hypothetical protein